MKRANGKGSVYRASDGRWWAKISLNGGKLRRKRLAQPQSERGAQATLRALLMEAAEGRVGVNDRITVRQFLEDWIETSVRPRLRPRTTETYETRVKLHVLPRLGDVRLAVLTPAQIRGLYASMAEQGASSSTVRWVHVVLGAALKQAEREGLIAHSPSRLVEAPSRSDYEAPTMPREHADAIIQGCQEHRHGPFWLFLLGTGVRFGEAAALRWSDVDLDAAQAEISHTLTYRRIGPGERQAELAPTKTRRSRRALALAPFVVAALRRQRAEIAKRRLRAREWHDFDLVFPSMDGGPLRNTHVGDAWRVFLRGLDLPAYRQHDLRHAVATLLRADGAELADISDLLGHASLTITHGIYAHTTAATRTRTAERIQSILGAAEG
ncbi:MAG: site-specific integrase [Chloroflexota bacterium]